MHPELHLTLHHQVEHELAEVLDRRLAIAQRRRGTPSAANRRLRARDLHRVGRMVTALLPTRPPTPACCPA